MTVFQRKVIWGLVIQTLAQRIARENAPKVLVSPVPTFLPPKDTHSLSLEFGNPASTCKFHTSFLQLGGRI